MKLVHKLLAWVEYGMSLHPALHTGPKDRGTVSSYDACIVGAGPIGLLLAAQLGKRGHRVLVVEKLEAPVPWSRAIGVSPPSLEILAELDLDRTLIEAGHPINMVRVYGKDGLRRELGRVNFQGIPSAYPFMLSVPQERTEALLARATTDLPGVHIRRGWEFTGIERQEASAFSGTPELSGRESIMVTIAPSAGNGNAPAGGDERIEARWLFGCDGAKSAVREAIGAGWRGRRYSFSFVMGDFQDTAGFDGEARLFFTPHGAVESFPLPGGLRRWIVQTRSYIENPAAGLIASEVARRTGIELRPDSPIWQSPFGVQRYIAGTYRTGRCVLLGDAAHIMSPIGGQGMNTGFADVDYLVPIVDEDLRSTRATNPQSFRTSGRQDGTATGISEGLEKALVRWETWRRRAFGVAADRAWRSMRLGTLRGRLFASIQRLLLKLLLNGPFKARVPTDYAMLSIPHRNRRSETVHSTQRKKAS